MASNTLIDKWRAVMCGLLPQPSDDYIVIAFPDEETRETYLARIDEWPEQEIRSVLRNMVGHSRTIGGVWDRLQLATLANKANISSSALTSALSDPAMERPVFSEYEARLIRSTSGRSKQPVWEGLTWILDLLPDAPMDALNAISAYITAHIMVLPDWRLNGLYDATSIIRARYIGHAASTFDQQRRLLLSVNWRDFEYLTGLLYEKLGYDVVVTAPTKDRGKDVIASRFGPTKEMLFVECKNWKGKVDIDVVTSLLGRVERGRATKGVVVATSGFTTGPASATEFAEQEHRLVLIGRQDLIMQLNERLGRDWPRRLDAMIAATRMRYERDSRQEMGLCFEP